MSQPMRQYMLQIHTLLPGQQQPTLLGAINFQTVHDNGALTNAGVVAENIAFSVFRLEDDGYRFVGDVQFEEPEQETNNSGLILPFGGK